MAELVAGNPGLADRLSEAERIEIASAARNNDTEAVRLMLEAGLPVTARGQHGGTPLHWAAFHGNRAMVEAILPYNPPLEDAENEFHVQAARLGDSRLRARVASPDGRLPRCGGGAAGRRGDGV